MHQQRSRAAWLAVALVAGCGAAWAQATIGGCQVFPANNIWNRRIDTLSVDGNSALYIESAGRAKHLIVDPSIPINVVDATQHAQALTKIDNADESDLGPIPIPEAPRLEGGGDAHLLIVQRGACRLYEIYAARHQGNGWSGSSTAFFDLNSNHLRPDGWTSTDGAGLPVAPGLLRYDEVRAGAIRHALRVTMPKTQRAYLWPARHYASHQESHLLAPMGLRLRLKASFDLSGFSNEARVVLTALKQYGAFVADNGGAFMLTATPDGWPPELITELHTVTGDAFEAVDESELMANPNTAQTQAPGGEVNVAFAPLLTLDAMQGASQSVTLGADAKLTAIEGATPGALLTLRVCQDARGGHAFVWPKSVHGAMKAGAAPGKCSVQQFVATAEGAWYAAAPGAIDQ
jgi:hypothetical protein